MAERPPLLTTTVAALEGLALAGYGVSIAVVALTSGLAGPVDVSSPSGVAVEIAVYLIFGAALGWIALGRLRGRDWATVPFLLAQLLALTVGIPMLTGAGVLAGAAITAAALAGLVGMWLEGRDREPLGEKH